MVNNLKSMNFSSYYGSLCPITPNLFESMISIEQKKSSDENRPSLYGDELFTRRI